VSYQDVQGFYVEQDDPPEPVSQWFCPAHNTVFDDGDVCCECESGWEPYPAPELAPCQHRFQRQHWHQLDYRCVYCGAWKSEAKEEEAQDEQSQRMELSDGAGAP
jgi:hypothetical protein